jgi:hypothetical protein
VTDGTLPSSFDFDFADHAPAVTAQLRRLWRPTPTPPTTVSRIAHVRLRTPAAADAGQVGIVHLKLLGRQICASCKTVTDGELKFKIR